MVTSITHFKRPIPHFGAIRLPSANLRLTGFRGNELLAEFVVYLEADYYYPSGKKEKTKRNGSCLRIPKPPFRRRVRLRNCVLTSNF